MMKCRPRNKATESQTKASCPGAPGFRRFAVSLPPFVPEPVRRGGWLRAFPIHSTIDPPLAEQSTIPLD
jgi:hypothetical protein